MQSSGTDPFGHEDPKPPVINVNNPREPFTTRDLIALAMVLGSILFVIWLFFG